MIHIANRSTHGLTAGKPYTVLDTKHYLIEVENNLKESHCYHSNYFDTYEQLTFKEYVEKYLPEEFAIVSLNGLSFEGSPCDHSLIANINAVKGFKLYASIPLNLSDLGKINLLSSLITIYSDIAKHDVQCYN